MARAYGYIPYPAQCVERVLRMMMWYFLASICLFLFSYTQVDLSLTLSQASLFQTIQKSFQYIGFYLRPIATYWYIGILLIFYALYASTLVKIIGGKINKKQLWWIIGGIAGILLFSYPAFSYDIFNYMFTAKTILVYHKNPYEVIPLQFSGVEPWLSFMRWTHLPSAYTPFWIVMTVPMYLLGVGYFLFTLWGMKSVAVAGYLASVWYVGKILEKKDPKNAVLGMAILALNPLVIMESLVSGHNDIVMMAFALMSIWALVQGDRLKSFFLMSLSTATKLMTGALLPVIFLGYRPAFYLIAMIVGLGYVVSQREILPWYFVWIMPFVALLPKKKWITIVAAAYSFGLLLRYAPYFYLGHWNDPVPMIKIWVTVVPPILAGVFVFLKRDRR
jgi:hypothetical protein